ncbi:MAG: DUF465 domain-containing protein [Pseudomonadota bacterium]
MSVSAHLQELKKKHEHLSIQVEKAQARPGHDVLQIAAMKKQKLMIKEEIHRLSQA